MKKIMWAAVLGVLSGVLGFVSALEAAELKFSGDFRVRGIYTDNLFDASDVGDDQEAFADGRFRLKIAATAGITTGIVVVDFTNSFGDPYNPACARTGCGTGNYRFGSANFGGDYNIVGVREAHLKLDFGETKLAFGRKQFRLGHSLILDDTMDAVAGKMESGGFDVMLAFGKLLDRNLFRPGNTGGDTDLYIAKVGFAHGGEEGTEKSDAHKVGLFSAYLKDRQPSFLTAATDNAQIWVVGLTADGRFGPIEAQFEVDTIGGELNNTGFENVDISGLNILLGGKVDLGSTADIGLTFLHTRGDEDRPDERVFTGISGNYVLGNILVNDNLLSDREGMCPSAFGGRIGSGAAGCGPGSGITAVKLAADLPDMTPECDLDVAVIWAKVTENPFGTKERDLGIELDLNMLHQIDEHLNMTVNLGYLFAGDFWKLAGGPGDNIMKAVASINYTF